MAVIVGKVTRPYKNKKGVIDGTSSTLFFQEDFPEGTEDCEGFRCFEEWTRSDCSDLHVGQLVEVLYRKGFEDKAQFNGVRLL